MCFPGTGFLNQGLHTMSPECGFGTLAFMRMLYLLFWWGRPKGVTPVCVVRVKVMPCLGFRLMSKKKNVNTSTFVPTEDEPYFIIIIHDLLIKGVLS